MNRNLDLIRTILLKIEADPTFDGRPQQDGVTAKRLGITDHDDMEITYNVALLIEAGYLVGNLQLAGQYQFPGIPFPVPVSKMTWAGHDFLDHVRDPKIWREAKEGAHKAGGFTFELLGALAKGLIKKKIEEHTGVKL